MVNIWNLKTGQREKNGKQYQIQFHMVVRYSNILQKLNVGCALADRELLVVDQSYSLTDQRSRMREKKHSKKQSKLLRAKRMRGTNTDERKGPFRSNLTFCQYFTIEEFSNSGWLQCPWKTTAENWQIFFAELRGCMQSVLPEVHLSDTESLWV